MRISVRLAYPFCALLAFNIHKPVPTSNFLIASGQMPSMANDKTGKLHLVYGAGDSIMYTYTADRGRSFSAPSVIAVLPGLFSFATRGPQIAATNKGLIVTACTFKGNIYSYRKENEGWKKGAMVNDADTAAKEGLMALSADGENAFAIWLDIRNNNGGGQRLFGAKSSDGGVTWSKNMLVYASPDKTVCECCKPSVEMRGKKVYAMFRNWLNGNRDLYILESSDGGVSFGRALKLGTGSWRLNGCPMDGGGLAINSKGEVQTVWKREAKIYTATPGMPERAIGEGRGCAIETVNNKNVYGWAENGKIVLLAPEGRKEIIGEGNQPVLKALDDHHVICVWEKDKHLYGSVLELQ